MPAITKRVYLTFPKDRVAEPVLCDMYDKLKVRFNIRTASVNDHVGIMAVEFISESAEKIVQALEFFRANGVMAEPIEMDVITG